MVKKKDSIDNRHHLQIKEFQTQYDKIPKLLNQIKTKKNMLSKLEQIDPINLNELELNQLYSLKLELPKLEEECNKIQKLEPIIKYYLETGSILTQYYQFINEKDKDLFSFKEIIDNKSISDNKLNLISCKFNYIIDPTNNYSTQIEDKTNLCDTCNIKKEILSLDGLLVCPNCYNSENIIVHTDKPSYNDGPCDNIYFSYKRINHFKEKLTKIQQLHNFKLPRSVEEKLCEMFYKLQEPFIKYRPANRSNFTSYSYVINKCLMILGYPEYAKYFSLLKSKDKLYQADAMWKKICNELKWSYYGSN